jgi:ABC-type Fe3+ transport system permease subunit
MYVYCSLFAAGLLVFTTALASFSAPYLVDGGFRVMTTPIVATRLNGDDRLAMVETAALLGTLWILPLAYLVRNLPVAGRAVLAGARQLDPALEEASASLGAGRARTLRRVTLPLLRPALAVGASLAFVTALR